MYVMIMMIHHVITIHAHDAYNDKWWFSSTYNYIHVTCYILIYIHYIMINDDSHPCLSSMDLISDGWDGKILSSILSWDDTILSSIASSRHDAMMPREILLCIWSRKDDKILSCILSSHPSVISWLHATHHVHDKVQ